MGLFNFIKGQLIEVIEWEDDSRDTVVYKFPDQDKEIKMGAQLTVRESQAAILINEGKIADVFPAGRHELSTRNMPILTTLRSWKFGFNSPFKVDVYFVNMRQISGMKWGTPQPVMVTDPEFSVVPLRAFGTFNFRVTDPKKFFTEFAGTDRRVTTDEVMEHFRGIVVSSFSSALKKSGKSIVEINANAQDLGTQLLPALQTDFAALGLELLKFNVENVSLPEDIQKALTSQDLKIRETRRVGTAQTEVDMQRMMQENMIQLQKLKAQAELSGSVEDMQKFMQMQAAIGMGTPGTPGATGHSAGTDMMQMAMGMNMAQQMMQGVNAAGAKPVQSKEDVMKTLKELGELKAAGVLTEDEFNAKKKELLAKL
jgi:membrane protease subunit (stomatin/prohibitin family)